MPCQKIVLSQRRKLVLAAHDGHQAVLDYDVNESDGQRYYRGNGNYNDWAMDYLPHPARRKPE